MTVARVARVFEVYRPNPFSFGPPWASDLMVGAGYAVIPLAIAGAVVLRRRRVTLLSLVAMVAAVTTAVALTWGSVRFRVPVDVSFLVLAAVTLDAALSTRRPARARHAD